MIKSRLAISSPGEFLVAFTMLVIPRRSPEDIVQSSSVRPYVRPSVCVYVTTLQRWMRAV